MDPGPPPVYCVLCGGPFAIPSGNWSAFSSPQDWWDLEQSMSEDPSKQWLCCIRLIGSVAHLQSLRPESEKEIKKSSDEDGIFVSDRASTTFLDGIEFASSEPDLDGLRLMEVDKDSGDALFPIHDRCLGILQEVIAWRAEFGRQPPPSSPGSLAKVYRFFCDQMGRDLEGRRQIIAKEVKKLYGNPIDYRRYGLEFDHGYYGARRAWAYLDWEVDNRNEWMCDDPIAVPGLPEFIAAVLGSGTSQELPSTPRENQGSCVLAPAVSNAEPGNRNKKAKIERLPLELLNYIVRLLSPSSVLALRLCSRTLLHRVNLDAHFWRSQIMNGCAIPFLYRVEPHVRASSTASETASGWAYSAAFTESTDYKLVITKIKGVLKSAVNDKDPVLRPVPPTGFRNRCRLWALADHLVTQASAEGKRDVPANNEQ